MAATTTGGGDRGAPHVELVLEDAGGASLVQSLVTALTSQHGARSCRFVARPTDDDHGDGAVATSPTFPVPTLAMMRGHETPEGGWPDEVRRALAEVDGELIDRGWQHAGVGQDWWARRYRRPDSETSDA